MATIAKISNGASAASALNYALGQDRPMHEKTEQWLQDHQLERPVELTNCRAVAVGRSTAPSPSSILFQYPLLLIGLPVRSAGQRLGYTVLKTYP